MMDVALSQFNSWMFLHHASRTAIFTWNFMVVDTRHKWDVLISYSWMDVIPTHNGRFYWRPTKGEGEGGGVSKAAVAILLQFSKTGMTTRVTLPH
jgi:hypothetical protein